MFDSKCIDRLRAFKLSWYFKFKTFAPVRHIPSNNVIFYQTEDMDEMQTAFMANQMQQDTVRRNKYEKQDSMTH